MATLNETLHMVMRRARVGAQTLSKLTGLPRSSIENWREGIVERPQHWRPLLQIAQALALTRDEVDALLASASYPPLATLSQAVPGEHPDRIYLQPWLAAANTSSAMAEQRLRQLEARLDAMTPSAMPLLHQLRTPAADFVGRADAIHALLTALRAARDGAVATICGVRGMGGIGKTELAYLIAQRLSGTFPDAQIVVNLRGASATPLSAEQAVQQVIHAFAPNVQLPDDLEELQTRYRALLHGRHILILADDARDAQQVRALVPPPGCALLITSRQRFTLPGMVTADLEQLAEAEAITLLRGICARLHVAEAQVLARICGYLPLALRVSGSILHNDPALSVEGYLGRLADARQRTLQLRDPDDRQLDVAASLALSYVQLADTAQQVFRQLGVLAADFSTELALAVVAAPASVDVAATLHLLLRRNLVMYDAAHGRWRLHDLVRDLALGYLDAAGEHEAAMWRYMQATVHITQATQAQYLAGGPGALAALARFDVEQAHIDETRRWAAAQAGTVQSDALLLADALATQHIGALRYDRRHERIPQLERARGAAHRLGEQRAEGQTLNGIGRAYMDLGEIRRAIPFIEQGLASAQAIGDRYLESHALNTLGHAYVFVGEAWPAIPLIERGLASARELGDRYLESHALNTLGYAYVVAGEAHRAIPLIEQGLTSAQATGNRRAGGYALASLGLAYVVAGEAQRAIVFVEQGLASARELGDRRLESYAQNTLSYALIYTGEARRAIPCAEQGLASARELGDRRLESYAQNTLGYAYIVVGQVRHGLSLIEQGLDSAQATGNRHLESQALLSCGLAYLALGRAHRGLSLSKQSLASAQALGNRYLESDALMSCGLAHLALGEIEQTIVYCEAALETTRALCNQRQEGYVLNALGCADAARGAYASALTRFTLAITIFQALGDRYGEARGSWELGMMLLRQGERARAMPLLCAAVAYEQEIEHTGAAEHAALLARLESSETLFDTESVLLGSVKLFSTALALYGTQVTLLAV